MLAEVCLPCVSTALHESLGSSSQPPMPLTTLGRGQSVLVSGSTTVGS